MKLFKELFLIGILLSTTIAIACVEDGGNNEKDMGTDDSDMGPDADTDADADTDTDADADTDTDSDTDGDAVTTLDGTMVLNTLSDEQVTQLCNDIWAYYESAISSDVFCKYKGLSYATSSSPHSEEQLIDNCSSSETACLGDPASAWTNNPGCSAPSGDCAATVADYSTCIRDTAADFIQTVSSMPTCDVFTMEATSLVWDFKGADRVASCMMTNCASLWPPDPKNI